MEPNTAYTTAPNVPVEANSAYATTPSIQLALNTVYGSTPTAQVEPQNAIPTENNEMYAAINDTDHPIAMQPNTTYTGSATPSIPVESNSAYAKT